MSDEKTDTESEKYRYCNANSSELCQKFAYRPYAAIAGNGFGGHECLLYSLLRDIFFK